MQNTNKKDGMPKIAEEIRKNKIGVVFVLVALVIVIGCYFLKFKSGKAEEQRVEESYTLKSDVVPAQIPAGVSVASTGDKVEPPESKEAIAARVAFVQEKQQQLQQRISAPLMLVSTNAKENVESATQDDRSKDANPNTQFLQSSSQKGVQTATAIAMGSLGTIIAAGNFIHAILEPATNSDLPGSLRAIVSEPVYSEDGANMLIPRGSRLIGEYKSGMQQGQSRIFIVWQRLITPEGVSVQLGSGGVDSLGVSGMGADSIDRHFWERFGTASLLSMIGAGTATLGVSGGDQDNSVSSYRTAIANSFSQSAGQSLQQDGSIAPTLRTLQGKPIMVFVAKDLQFESAMKSIKQNVSIF
jgi:type IV secretory pathway VirB10-like protein